MYFYWRHNTYCEPGIYSGKLEHGQRDTKFCWTSHPSRPNRYSGRC